MLEQIRVISVSGIVHGFLLVFFFFLIHDAEIFLVHELKKNQEEQVKTQCLIRVVHNPK